MELYSKELRKGSAWEEKRARRRDRFSLTETRDASEGQRGPKLTSSLQRMLEELREKEGKRRRAIGLKVRLNRNLAVAEESLVLKHWIVTPSAS